MSPTTDEYVLSRLGSMEALLKTFCATIEDDRKVSARMAAVKEQAAINSIFSAVKGAMEVERENNRHFFNSLESRLASCTAIQDAAIDVVKNDLGEMRIEVTSHGAHVKAQLDLNESITRQLETVITEVQKLVHDPGEKAKKVLQLVGAGAVPVAGYGLFELVKALIK